MTRRAGPASAGVWERTDPKPSGGRMDTRR